MSKFTKDQIDCIRQVFESIDKDNSGSIDAAEFEAAIKESNLEISHDEVVAKIKEADKNNDNKVSFEEFVKHLEKEC
jgi:Ca2+-binding EF-hand superfamily protein